MENALNKSSRSQIFFKIGALSNIAKSTGKHLCWSFFLMKVACLKAYNFIKKRFQHRCFPMNIAKFLRALFLQNTCCVCFCLKIRNVFRSIDKSGLRHRYLPVNCTKFFRTAFDKTSLSECFCTCEFPVKLGVLHINYEKDSSSFLGYNAYLPALFEIDKTRAGWLL